MEKSSTETVIVRAYSPDERPILVLERGAGRLCAAYYETDYDLGLTKSVTEEWLRDNAIGRHSFEEVSPAVSLKAAGIREYVDRKLIGSETDFLS